MKREHSLRFRTGLARILQGFSLLRSGRLPDRIRSIVILTPECFGDCILLTCLLQQLRAALPDVSIHMVTFRQSSTLFFGSDPNVSSVFYAKSGLPSWFRYLFSHRFDLLFSPKESLSFNFLLQSFLLRSGFRVGHHNEYHQGIFDRLIDMDYFTHVIRRNGSLLNVLGLENVDCEATVKPYLPPLPVGEEVLSFCRYISSQDMIGINLSAGSKTRCWTSEKWRELVGRFPNKRFVIFSTPEDRCEKQILEVSLVNVEPSPKTANLGEVGAILKQLKFLVTPDTSLVHLAACYDLSVIALYRNNRADIERFPPMSTLHELVVSPNELVGSISVDAVDKAVRRMIEALPIAPEVV